MGIANGHFIRVKLSNSEASSAKLTVVSNEERGISQTAKPQKHMKEFGKDKPMILKRCSEPIFNFLLEITVSWGKLPKRQNSNFSYKELETL